MLGLSWLICVINCIKFTCNWTCINSFIPDGDNMKCSYSKGSNTILLFIVISYSFLLITWEKLMMCFYWEDSLCVSIVICIKFISGTLPLQAQKYPAKDLRRRQYFDGKLWRGEKWERFSEQFSGWLFCQVQQDS